MIIKEGKAEYINSSYAGTGSRLIIGNSYPYFIDEYNNYTFKDEDGAENGWTFYTTNPNANESEVNFLKYFEIINETLPEYWKLKISAHNIEAITNWRIGVFGLYGDISNKDYIYSYGTTRKPLLMKDDYISITFNQFKEDVLKNSVNKFINKDFLAMNNLLIKLGIV